MKPHDFLTLIGGFALGWFAHKLRERREKPRKRSRAIPAGTEAEKKPRKPRKPKAASPDPVLIPSPENGD